MSVRETGWSVMDWIQLGPVESLCEPGNEPLGFIKC
jgi:hypothetical protein